MEKLFKVTITETLVRNIGVKAENLQEATKKVNGVSPPNRSKTLIRNFSPVQELGIKDFLAVFS